MKNIIKILICVMFVITFISFAHAQSQKTAKGYFCGFSEGDGGYLSIRVGGEERTFAMLGEEPKIKYVGFRNRENTDFYKLPVGSEIIVNYVYKIPKGWSQKTYIVRKLTLTGKVNKKTKSCGFGL